jgi:hypothetical protein
MRVRLLLSLHVCAGADLTTTDTAGGSLQLLLSTLFPAQQAPQPALLPALATYLGGDLSRYRSLSLSAPGGGGKGGPGGPPLLSSTAPPVIDATTAAMPALGFLGGLGSRPSPPKPPARRRGRLGRAAA